MRKESLMFVSSIVATVFLAGAVGTVGLFVFGFAWLLLGDDVNLQHPDIEHHT